METPASQLPILPEWLAEAGLIERIVERLKSARAVQLIGHIRPDGDCIGSLLAMGHLLRQWGIPYAMAAQNIPESGYDALEGFDAISESPDPSLQPDCVLHVDCANLERGIENWTAPAPIINIDHHVSNPGYGEINWVQPDCAATGEIIYWLVRVSGAQLTPPLAENLLIAIATDTGSFGFSNTGPAQHRIAAHLIEAGASVSRIARIAFGSQHFDGVRLTGYVMSSMQLDCDGRLGWAEIRSDTYDRYGGEDKLPENLVGCLFKIRGVRVALLFHEISGGVMRVNLRSDGLLDVSGLAALWGGGGHPNAAGLSRPSADYEKDRDEILRRIMDEMAAVASEAHG